jgi:SAM-dependent methyltransferase
MNKDLEKTLRAEMESYARSVNQSMVTYLHLHWPRFIHLADELSLLIQKNKLNLKSLRILDIGPSFQTKIFEKIFPDAGIDTLGFEDGNFIPERGIHISYDLTKLQEQKPLPPIKPYDVIIMGEVIEHLYISPYYVFKFLNSILNPEGFLLITTPNAVSLENRWGMLWGFNPYEKIRENFHDPGHFREYTLKELNDYAMRCSFKVYKKWLGFDMAVDNSFKRSINFLIPFLPPSLQPNLFVIYRKPFSK